MQIKNQTPLVRKTVHVFMCLVMLCITLGAQNLPSAYAQKADQPNLAPIAPLGWSGPIVASTAVETNQSTVLYAGLDTYIDWAVTNWGGSPAQPFKSCIYYEEVNLQCWENGELAAGELTTQLDQVLTIPTTAGLHHVEIVADVDNVITESNEQDKSWGFDFEWMPSELGTQQAGPPLINDALIAPDMDMNIQSLTGSSAPGFYNTSDYIIGSVAVGIVFPESTGSSENWTTVRRDQVISEIQTALNWWALQASQRGINLSFQYDIQYQISTTYEPITLSSANESLWINQVMTNMGYSGSTHMEKVRSYDNALRTQKNTNWAYTIFVVDSFNDTDGTFSNGYFGYAYLGGPFVILTTDNGGYGIDRMDEVITHETGHIFGAADNYYQAGYGGCQSTTDLYGYLGIPNSNCQYNNPGADPNVLMNNNSLNLHWTNEQQVGWRDSNANGRMDPVDTVPAVTLSAYSPDPTTNTQLTYTGGKAYDNPYPHSTCCVSQDVTINTITSVQYRVDGGTWTNVTPGDGSFNTDYEQFSFTTPALTGGAHTIEVKAQNSVGAVNSPYWSDTVTVQGAAPVAFNKTAPSNGAVGQSTSPTLTWGTSSGAASYEYCYDTTNDNACSNWASNGTSTSKILSGLSVGVTYYWQARAVNAGGTTYANGSATAYWSFATQPTAPGAFNKSAPTNGATGQSSAPIISWGASSGAASYEYCYDTTNDSACSSWVSNGANTSKTLSGLSANTTYYWHVRAINGGGTTYANASSTAFWFFTTQALVSPPGAFSKSSPANGATGQSTAPTLTWGTSSGATSYDYCYDTTNDSACSNWASNGVSTSKALSGLSASTTYYWQIRANNSGGTTFSDANTFWSFTTLASGDAFEADNTSIQAKTISSGSPQTHSIVPANDVDWVKFTLGSPSAITLETTGGAGSDTRMWLYDGSLNQIDYNDDNGVNFYSFIDRVCAGEALPAGTYYVKIDEYENNNEIPSYDISFDITQSCTATIPIAPSDLIVSGTTANSISLSWQDNSNNESGFQIYRWSYDDVTSQWTFLPLATVGAGVTTFTELDLLCEDDFNFYEVSAYNNTGESAHADWVQGTTGACPFNELSITNISFSPAPRFSNDNIFVLLDIQNTSNKKTTSFWVDVYVDDTPTGCADWSNYAIKVGELAANTTETWWVIIPSGELTAGTHQIKAFIDSGCEVAEGNESNNVIGPANLSVSAPPAAPSHDNIGAAKSLSPIPYSDSVSVAGATVASNDPAVPVSSCNLAPGLATVWYSITPSAKTLYNFDTLGSDYDTYIAIWSGSPGNLSIVGCNDDFNNNLQSSLQASLNAATTYYIEVAEYNGMISAHSPMPSIQYPAGATASAPMQRSLPAGISETAKAVQPGDVQAQAGGALQFHVLPMNKVSSITRALANPAYPSSIDFIVTFTESVTGVGVGDFTLTTGGVSGATVSGVSGSGSVYTVTVNTGIGGGTIRLDIPLSATITDLIGDSLSNLPFTAGQTFTINKPIPKAPALRSPRSSTITSDATPTFWWVNSTSGQTHEIVFATDAAFTNIVDSEIVSGSPYTPTALFTGGNYFWRVRGRNIDNQPGAWSLTRTFTIDTAGPAAPVSSSPANSTSSNRTPTFRWLRVSSAVLYEFQYDDSSNLLSPLYTVTVRGTFRRPPAMPDGYILLACPRKRCGWKLGPLVFIVHNYHNKSINKDAAIVRQ